MFYTDCNRKYTAVNRLWQGILGIEGTNVGRMHEYYQYSGGMQFREQH